MNVLFGAQGILFGPVGWLVLITLLACGDHKSKLDQQSQIHGLIDTSSNGSGFSIFAKAAPPQKRTTHTIICGDSPKLEGDDSSGRVTHDAKSGRCTVVFSTDAPRACTIKGGTIFDSSPQMMTVRGLTGSTFAYTCVAASTGATQ